MKPTPRGWPRLSSAIFYDDAAQAIDWLCKAFGFTVRLRVDSPGGRVEHSELLFGEAVIMVAQSGDRPSHPNFPPGASPRSVGGGNTQCLILYVDDIDAHCEQARAAGAAIVEEPKLHDYGENYWADRGYGAVDPDGHLWWFSQRIRDPKE